MSIADRSIISSLHLPTARARYVLERNVLVYRRAPVVVFSGFFEPVFFLLSMKYGVGRLVGDVRGPGGHLVAYAQFVAPGLLAASAMIGAFYESTYQLFQKLIEGETYRGMLATPVSVSDMATGEVFWAMTRGLIYAIGFLVMSLSIGAIVSWWALLALPAALLICAAFAAAGQVVTSNFRTWADLEIVSLVTMPLFMCSTTFFPLDTYPRWAQIVVELTPLYHGVALERALTSGHVTGDVFVHIAYLVVMATGLLALSSHRLHRRFSD